MFRWWRSILGITFLLIVAACSGSTDPALRQTTASTLDPVAERPVAPIEWEPCLGSMECASIEVPLDYRVADGETISIRISRAHAANPEDRIGVLFTNPGGPGRSGIVHSLPDTLFNKFDIIGFDPRGVGESEPSFACGPVGESLDHLLTVDDIVDTPAEDAAVSAAVQLCADSMGEAAGLIHTDYVVRDMDQIRRALGEEQISYLGFSYGSTIGVWYASLFPDNVRAMVIDGAPNPLDNLATDDESAIETQRDILAPWEEEMSLAIAACQTSACPMYNDGDPESFYLSAADKFPLVIEAAGDNPNAGYFGIISRFYTGGGYDFLWEAVAALEEDDDPVPLYRSASFQFDERGPRAASLTGHINCLDSWALLPEFDRADRLASEERLFAAEAEINEEFPLIGPSFNDRLTSSCSHMDALGTPALDVPFDGGGAPILVLGNRGDRLTPFEESEELADEVLTNGFLVEVDVPTHTIYLTTSCARSAVHAALINLEYSDERLVC